MTNNYVQFGETFEWRGASWILSLAEDESSWPSPPPPGSVSIVGYQDQSPVITPPLGESVVFVGLECAELMRCIRREGEFAQKTHLEQVTDVVFGAAERDTDRSFTRSLSAAPAPAFLSVRTVEQRLEELEKHSHSPKDFTDFRDDVLRRLEALEKAVRT